MLRERQGGQRVSTPPAELIEGAALDGVLSRLLVGIDGSGSLHFSA
jgi:hypothetical protein